MAIVVRSMGAGRKRSKYGNKKVTADGITFDSRREWLRYLELMLAERNGLIVKLEVHPKFDILINGKKICAYVGDFMYLIPLRKIVPEGTSVDVVWIDGEGFERIVEDTKGFRTREFILKKRLMSVVLGIEVKEI